MLTTLTNEARDFIRKQPTHLSAPEVRKLAAEEGHVVADHQVYNLRKKMAAEAPKKGKGKKMANGHAKANGANGHSNGTSGAHAEGGEEQLDASASSEAGGVPTHSNHRGEPIGLSLPSIAEAHAALKTVVAIGAMTEEQAYKALWNYAP
jgi:hypothetical protein